MATEWDAAGNQKTKVVGSATATLTWDAEGELTGISGAGLNSTNEYDAGGERLLRTDASGTTTVFLPAGQEIKVTSAGAVTASRWYTFAGKTVAVRTGTGLTNVSSIVGDHLGTIVASIHNTNWTAAVTRTRNDPFGAARSTAASTVSGHGFLGANVDATGFVALGARYYDPGLGRFLSADPVLDPLNTAQFNAYDYAGHNPVTWSDPSGLDFWSGLWNNAQKAAKAVGNFIKDNASTIVSIGVGALVTGGCLAMTGGVGSVGCFIAGGAAAGAVSNLYRTVVEKKPFSVGGFIRDTVIGGATGLLGPVAGAVARVVAPAVRAAVTAVARPVQQFTSRLGASIKPAATPRVSVSTPSVRASQSAAQGAPGRSSSCALANSFTAGTLVLFADGTRIPIQHIALGDEVLATDPETGETAAREVIALIEGTGAKELVTLTVEASDGSVGTVVATTGHPIWTKDGWTDAGDLTPGQWLRTSSGTWVLLTAIQYDHREETVYNLTVENTHTCYVYAGAAALLTHNCGGHLPTVTFSRSRGPAIGANFDAAVSAGAPTTLTRAASEASSANRRAALSGQPRPPRGQSLDEYPFASTVEGGAGATVAPVPVAEQFYQGGVLSAFYRNSGIRPGGQFNVRFD